MSSTNRRFNVDIKNLKEVAHNVEVDGFVVTCDIHGPKDTCYEGGVWKLRIEVNAEFPFKSPSVGFMSKIYHPNIDFSSGSVCLNVLNQTWSPIYNLMHIYTVFIPQLLQYPNPDDPLNSEAATLYTSNAEAFAVKVKQFLTV